MTVSRLTARRKRTDRPEAHSIAGSRKPTHHRLTLLIQAVPQKAARPSAEMLIIHQFPHVPTLAFPVVIAILPLKQYLQTKAKSKQPAILAQKQPQPPAETQQQLKL